MGVEQAAGAKEEQSFLATFVENADDAILACTPAGVIRVWNRGAEKILGYPAEETIGKPVSMLLVPERQARLPRLIDRVLRGIAVPQYETICLHRDGRRMHASVTGSPMRNGIDPMHTLFPGGPLAPALPQHGTKHQQQRARAVG